MKVCLLSDSHDHIPLMDAAVAQARTLGAEAVLHCGDVVAPSTLRCLEKHGLPAHVIHGNNTGDMFTLGRLAADPSSVIQYHGMDAGLDLDGRRIFMVHYPHYAHAMATTGDWDIVCCGHSHNPKQQWLTNIKGGRTLLLNPGTVGGVGQAPATWFMVDLATLSIELHEVDKALERRVLEPLAA